MSYDASCTSCQRLASSIPERPNGQLLLCARCKGVGKQVGYCSRECQLADYPSHKSSCGRLIPSATSAPSTTAPTTPSWPQPPALRLHSQSLSSLPSELRETISYLYWPSSPLSTSPADPTPIVLPPPSRALFALLLATASTSGNRLSVNLMYSILLEYVEDVGGNEGRLVQQLSEEFGFDLGRALREEEENDDDEGPSEEELEEAIGGPSGQGTLLRWQMSEASKGRGFDGDVEAEEELEFGDETGDEEVAEVEGTEESADADGEEQTA